MATAHVFEIRQNNDAHRSAGLTGFLNTTPAMVALMDRLGDKILIRDGETMRDAVYMQAKRCGRKVGIRKVQIIIDDRVHNMLEVELTAMDAGARVFTTGTVEEE